MILRALEAPLLRLEGLFARTIPDALNPLAQTGAVANTSLLVALASGVLLLFWYTPSVGGAHESVLAMSQAPWTAGLVRSLHRYSSDVAMFFVLVHALRMTLARRFDGARWLAWVTGLVATGLTWLVGWLGYWLVWDERARQVALGSARMLDVVPVFADPLSRSFVADATVNSLLFFIVFFIHVLLPLALAAALWLHVARVARPRFLTGRGLTLLLLGALVVVSLLHPATTADKAQMAVHPQGFTMDWWYLAPLAITDRLTAGAAWSVLLAGSALALSAPWWAAARRLPPATVKEPLCNACLKCAADCPYDAISMVPRTDGRDFPVKARVDVDKCVGCGICAGSCDTAGIGMPSPRAADVRQRLDRWMDLSARSGERPLVVFACAESAGARLEVASESGACPEVPGARVVSVPCAGWVHPLLVERALRRGARGVLVVACRPATCRYREGATWTALRLAGEREPALRRDKVDASRVQLVSLDRPELSALRRTVADFERGATAPLGAGRKALMAAAAGLVMVAAGALVVVGSDAAYATPPRRGSELVVSFKHPGTIAERCRDLTEEEKELLPVHMRAQRTCERARTPVRLRVVVDGSERLVKTLEPVGLWSDGASLALETIPMEPGTRRVEIAIGDTPKPEEWAFQDGRALEFREGERRAVLFDRAEGFSWH